MGNAYIPDNVTGHLEWCGTKIKNLLELHTFHSTSAIIKQLTTKDIVLNPYELQKLFSAPVLGGLVHQFKLLRKIMDELREQGIYIPYILDESRMENGIWFIVKSKFHKLGEIPVTKHNALDRWRWVQNSGKTQNVLDLHNRIEEAAKTIHAGWIDLPGWSPWTSLPYIDGYQECAMQLGRERVDAEDRENMKWDEVMALCKSHISKAEV